MNGADIAALNGSEDTKQDTVLQIAAWQGRSSVVRTLLDHKAVSVNDNGRFGGPLRAAAISASRLYHEEMSRIEQNGRGNSSRSSLDEMLVERQARDELFAIAKRSHQPASDASLAKTDPSGTVLSGSAVLQSVSDVLVDFRNLLRSPYQTPYTTILAYGSTIFELLLANEASQTFEGSDKDLEEAFFVAAEEGPSLLVRVLDDVLSKKLSPTLMREKRSKALCLAASAGDLSAIEILTRKGVDLNFKDDDGWTALRKYTHIRLWLQFSFSLFLTGISPLYLMFP
jgi:ankyrin repeat protein